MSVEIILLFQQKFHSSLKFSIITPDQAAFTSEGWPSNLVKTVYYVVFFLWLATVHAWIAFKAELFPMDFYRQEELIYIVLLLKGNAFRMVLTYCSNAF